MSQADDNNLSFESLGVKDERRIINALVLLRALQGRVSKPDLDSINRLLRVLMEWHMPARTILALLAYHLEEAGTPSTQERMAGFSRQVWQIVEDFRVLNEPFDSNGEDLSLRKVRRSHRLPQLFIKAYTRLEAVLLHLAAHIVKMRSIEFMDYHEARLLAEDNEDIFLPIVEMLGMWKIRRELGDASLKILQPKKNWNRITQRQELLKGEHQRCYEAVKKSLAPQLVELGIDGQIQLHFSPPSSIYRRLLQGEELEKLVRKVKIDLIVPAEDDCYRALGLIHQQFSPTAGRTVAGKHFRELIASPKANGYRALITTVSPGQRVERDMERTALIEFRIYTPEMAKTNAYGVVAARFLPGSPVKIRNAWWENEALLEFVRTHATSSGTEEIYVFTPTGEVYCNLPQGSTPIDYAYRIHSEVGDHCKRIWLNGRAASYAEKLRNGDLVEIEVDPDYPGPDARWLTVVKTSTAKKHIKRALKQRQVTPRGRKIIDKILKRELAAYHLPDVPSEKVDKFLEETARYFNYSDVVALYLDLADPRQSPHSRQPSPNQIVTRFIASQLVDHVAKANRNPLGISKNKIKFAQCQHGKNLCRVTPGADIVGRLVRPGTGREEMIIYRCDCPRAPEPENAVPLIWLGDRRSGEPVRVTIQAVDRYRLLGDVLDVIYEQHEDGLNLLSVQANLTREWTAGIEMTIDAPDYRPVEILSAKLSRLRESGQIDGLRIDALSPLEKMLLVESDALPNPYTPGLARDRRIFKGRNQEIQEIVNCLTGPQNLVVLYGINRVGKTSLLHYLHDYVVEEYNLLPVIINMLGLEEHRETRFWLEMATEINRVIPRTSRETKKLAKSVLNRIKQDPFGGFCEWLQEAKTAVKGRKLLIMVDELNVIDELWRQPDEAQTVIYRLRSLVEKQTDVAFILCVQETLYKQTIVPGKKVVSWPLLRAGVPIRLDYLDRQAAERLIREPMGQMIQYENGVVDKTIYLTACHPLYLQHILHELVKRAGNNRRKFETVRVTSTDLEAVIPELLANGEHLFSDFLKECRKFKCIAVLSAIAYISKDDSPGVTTTQLEAALRQRGVNFNQIRLAQTLQQLREIGILTLTEEVDQPRFHIRVPLFRRWLVGNRPYHLIRPDGRSFR